MSSEYERVLEKRMRLVLDLAARNTADGYAPFAALVIDRRGRVAGEGVNDVRRRHDPLAHAEVEALRDAGRRLKATNLSGMILLASGEPCGLCRLAAYTAGVTEVFYAVDSDTAADHGYDYRDSYGLLTMGRGGTAPTCRHYPIEGSETAFDGKRTW